MPEDARGAIVRYSFFQFDKSATSHFGTDSHLELEGTAHLVLSWRRPVTRAHLLQPLS
jgi:hypothetical protein